MSRWIDAEKELKELKDMKVKGEVFTTAVNFAIRVIEEAPSIDLDETAEEIRFLEGLESKVLDKIKQADTPQPETQAETQNSNLTFEKRTMRDCYNCKRYETEGECIECHYEPKAEPQTEDLIKQADALIEFEKELLKDEPQTDCAWGKGEE